MPVAIWCCNPVLDHSYSNTNTYRETQSNAKASSDCGTSSISSVTDADTYTDIHSELYTRRSTRAVDPRCQLPDHNRIACRDEQRDIRLFRRRVFRGNQRCLPIRSGGEHMDPNG